MPSSIYSTSSSPGGLITTGATDNELVIQTGGTTAISIDASQNVAVAGDLTVSGSIVGGGDVSGPASATDNAVARFDGTTGKVIENSAVTIADTSGNITTGGVVLTANGTVSDPSFAASGDTNTGMYFPAADTLGFTTGGTQRAAIDSSGNFQFNSGYGSVATAYGCRAWVNFDGTGTPAIRASGNVSSITDNGGSGNYTVNFTSNMPDANYCCVATCTDNTVQASGNQVANPDTYAVGSVRIILNGSSVTADQAIVNVAIFR